MDHELPCRAFRPATSRSLKLSSARHDPFGRSIETSIQGAGNRKRSKRCRETIGIYVQFKGDLDGRAVFLQSAITPCGQNLGQLIQQLGFRSAQARPDGARKHYSNKMRSIMSFLKRFPIQFHHTPPLLPRSQPSILRLWMK